MEIFVKLQIKTYASWGTYGFVKDMQAASFISLGFTGAVDVAISASDVADIIFSGFCFLLGGAHKLKSFAVVAENLQAIDSLISSDGNGVGRKSKILAASWFLGLPCLYVLDLLMWGNFTWTGVNSYFAYYYCYSLVVLQGLQFWLAVATVKVKISNINRDIENILRRRLPRRRILPVMKSYHLAVEAIDSINRCFKVSVSMMLLSCYLHLITSPYQLFVMLTSNETGLLNYVYLLWVSLQVFRLASVVEVCHACAREVERTKRLVPMLWTLEGLDRGLKNEVKALVVVVNKKVKFWSYGLAKIDRTVFGKIAGSISGYWMILLQFSSRSGKW